jgi:hypothetical protein
LRGGGAGGGGGRRGGRRPRRRRLHLRCPTGGRCWFQSVLEMPQLLAVAWMVYICVPARFFAKICAVSVQPKLRHVQRRPVSR